MSEYYDKNKFSGRQGGTPPPPRPTPPPPRRPAAPSPGNGRRSTGGSEVWWRSWPAIIILFALGLWPIALGLLIYNIMQEDKEQRQRGPAQSHSAASQAASETAAQEAIRKARERALERELAQQAHDAEEYIAPVRPVGEKPDEQAVTRKQYQAKAEPAQAAPPTPAEVRRDEAARRRKDAERQKMAANAGKAGKPQKFKAPFSTKLMQCFGGLLLFIGAISMSEALPDMLNYGGVYLDDVFTSLGFLACGGALFWRGRHVATMTRRSQRYILAIGTADTMSIAEIAKRVNRTPEKAEKELQKLIDKGYLGEDAYIDHQRGYFLRFGATLDEDRNSAQAQASEVPEEAEEGYSGVLRSIRRANDRIADEELSRKIDRIEQVSALIFKEVEEHPEKRERIHTFFDYYLPTTQKLLDTYADFEETGVEGENLKQAKDRIEQTMDAIVGGFEHQLDQLYSTDAMDVVSDIKVMEAMLNRDISSAAKDFGYDQAEKKDQDKPEDGGVSLTL